MKRTAVVLVIGAILVALLIYSQQRTGPVVVSGFVEADEIRVGSRVGGRVAEVLVEEGNQVAASDPLIRLEPFDLNERLAEAEHSLAKAEAGLRKLKAGYRVEEVGQAQARLDQSRAVLQKLTNGPRPQEIRSAEADLALAIAERKLARTNYQRVEALFGKEAADQSGLDAAETRLSVADQTVEARQAQLDLLKDGSRKEDIAEAQARVAEFEQELGLLTNGYRVEEISEAEATRDAAAAVVRAIKLQLSELSVTAPMDGVVEAIDIRPGDLIAPNAPAVSLIDRSRMWVRAYIPENRLNLKIGDSLGVRVDSFPGKEFTGKLVYISPQAEFTPGNVQTPEERSKQVFRIKLQLTNGSDDLRPGMAADVILSAGATSE